MFIFVDRLSVIPDNHEWMSEVNEAALDIWKSGTIHFGCECIFRSMHCRMDRNETVLVNTLKNPETSSGSGEGWWMQKIFESRLKEEYFC